MQQKFSTVASQSARPGRQIGTLQAVIPPDPGTGGCAAEIQPGGLTIRAPQPANRNTASSDPTGPRYPRLCSRSSARWPHNPRAPTEWEMLQDAITREGPPLRSPADI